MLGYSPSSDLSAAPRDVFKGPSVWHVRVLCLCAMAGLLALDFSTTRLNPAIIYISLLVICLQWGDRKQSWRWGLGIVALTYVGYFFGARGAAVGSKLALLHKYAMLNRTFAACTVCGITFFARNQWGLRRPWVLPAGGAARRYVVALLSDEIRVTGVCFVGALGIFVFDLLSPAHFNLPILYGMLVVLACQAQSRSFVFWFTAALVVFTFVGYFASPGGAGVRENCLTNRALAACAFCAVAVVMRRPPAGAGAAKGTRARPPARRLRILHVISGIHPKSGGPTAALVGFTNAQASLAGDADVRVISTWVSEEEVLTGRRLEGAGVGVTLVGPARGPLRRHSDLRRAVARAVEEADVVHIHGVWEAIQHYAADHARWAGIPYVVRPCGMLDHWSLTQHRFRKAFYLAWRMRDHLNGAAALHLTSKAECEAVENLALPTPLIIEPLGLDLSEFDPLPVAGSFRGRLPVRAGGPIVLFFGRVCAKKGLHVLIPAMARLAEREATLVIAGPVTPEYRSLLGRLIADHQLEGRVHFAGMLTGRDRVAALADADLFVLPSAEENFGIAVAEAMAAGCPVIVSPQVAVAEHVLEWGAGAVAEREPAALARVMDEWLAAPVRRREAGARGRRAVFEHFDWDRIARGWTDHYQHLVAIARRRALAD